MALSLFILAALFSSLPARALQWPEAPAQARIRFVSTLSGPPASSAAPSYFKSLLRMALGMDPAKEGQGPLFQRPTALAIAGGRLYVADPGLGRVLVTELKSGKQHWVPSEFRTRLPSPVGVAATSQGTIFVSDSELKKVVVYDARDGKVAGNIELPSGARGRPTGLALDEGAGRLYVADTLAHRIEAFDLSGKHLFGFGSRGEGMGQLNYPTYLWLDGSSGRLWVCDSANFRLQCFDRQGKRVGGFGEAGDSPGHLPRPRGLAQDSEGNLYSVDAALEAVQVFDKQGRLLVLLGGSGAQEGFFSLPAGIAFDSQDRFYVADTYNARVQVFQFLKKGPS